MDESPMVELVVNLVCFTPHQVRAMLKVSDGALDCAANWLFSHMVRGKLDILFLAGCLYWAVARFRRGICTLLAGTSPSHTQRLARGYFCLLAHTHTHYLTCGVSGRH